jgi:hypothetical protein
MKQNIQIYAKWHEILLLFQVNNYKFIIFNFIFYINFITYKILNIYITTSAPIERIFFEVLI